MARLSLIPRRTSPSFWKFRSTIQCDSTKTNLSVTWSFTTCDVCHVLSRINRENSGFESAAPVQVLTVLEVHYAAGLSQTSAHRYKWAFLVFFYFQFFCFSTFHFLNKLARDVLRASSIKEQEPANCPVENDQCSGSHRSSVFGGVQLDA